MYPSPKKYFTRRGAISTVLAPRYFPSAAHFTVSLIFASISRHCASLNNLQNAKSQFSPNALIKISTSVVQFRHELSQQCWIVNRDRNCNRNRKLCIFCNLFCHDHRACRTYGEAFSSKIQLRLTFRPLSNCSQLDDQEAKDMQMQTIRLRYALLTAALPPTE